MNWVSFYGSFIFLFAIVGLFLWNLNIFFLSLLLLFLGILTFLNDSFYKVNMPHFTSSFWLFIGSEVFIFMSLITSYFWYQDYSELSLSHYLDLPFIGSFILIGSSLTATCYHHESNNNIFYLPITIFLGMCFVFIQYLEFTESFNTLYDLVYSGAAYLVVGLHFSHVLIGLALLIGIYISTSLYSGDYYNDLVVWYWHFVDYIWLLVYTVVYLF
uniref:Cytochrome c oxidase subunit 3 n=1 Tax=Aglaiogyrodactylus forficulatus TaxID=1853073 RepID=A0A173G4S8_9PLAT|nr:cytochrome c oxidase subunit III [Aglaiogyrodactylus forficulatus]ANH20413.1 cytochrome c oxidase subunit III [Aglaiogyrodactylus forficulatus]